RDAVIRIAHPLNPRVQQKFRQTLGRIAGKTKLHELVRMVRRVAAENEPERPAAIAPAVGLSGKLHVCCKTHAGRPVLTPPSLRVLSLPCASGMLGAGEPTRSMTRS